MESNPLLRQIFAMKRSLLDEGILDAQFIELEKLNSDENPNFVEDTINLYFEETKKTIITVEEELAKPFIDYNVLDTCLHKLKGSSVSIGANKAKIEVDMARKWMEQGNIQGLKGALQLLKWLNETFVAKLDSYFQLVRQVRDAKW